QASQLYTGELLEALETREPAFDDWLMGRRNQLREHAIGAMTHLLAHFAQSSEPERAIAIALRLLALDPLQESVHRALMQLYARQGRRSSALRQFEICREVLARELGTHPQAQTMQLRDAIEGERRTPELPLQHGAAHWIELRPVAVVFAEASSLGEESELEGAQAHTQPLVAAATDIAARFGGTLERRSGTGITLVFGIPAAHSNDVERAARCALALRQQVSDARFGLAAGPVLVTQQSVPAGADNITGEPLGLSARLAAAA